MRIAVKRAAGRYATTAGSVSAKNIGQRVAAKKYSWETAEGYHRGTGGSRRENQVPNVCPLPDNRGRDNATNNVQGVKPCTIAVWNAKVSIGKNIKRSAMQSRNSRRNRKERKIQKKLCSPAT